jgi:hypothetical protein
MAPPLLLSMRFGKAWTIFPKASTGTSRHLIYLKNSGILTTRKINQWVFYQIKEEVADILKQMLDFIRRDQALQHDQQIFQTLFTNRELALNKHKIRPLGQPTSQAK